jgi:hypothetical protein
MVLPWYFLTMEFPSYYDVNAMGARPSDERFSQKPLKYLMKGFPSVYGFSITGKPFVQSLWVFWTRVFP